jgi:septal ring factor EnvC (AmiA/AmiB activator)
MTFERHEKEVLAVKNRDSGDSEFDDKCGQLIGHIYHVAKWPVAKRMEPLQEFFRQEAVALVHAIQQYWHHRTNEFLKRIKELEKRIKELEKQIEDLSDGTGS